MASIWLSYDCYFNKWQKQGIQDRNAHFTWNLFTWSEIVHLNFREIKKKTCLANGKILSILGLNLLHWESKSQKETFLKLWLGIGARKEAALQPVTTGKADTRARPTALL